MFYDFTDKEYENVKKHIYKQLKLKDIVRNKHVLYEVYKDDEQVYTFNTYQNTPHGLYWLDAGQIRINFKERTQKRQVLKIEFRHINKFCK